MTIKTDRTPAADEPAADEPAADAVEPAKGERNERDGIDEGDEREGIVERDERDEDGPEASADTSGDTSAEASAEASGDGVGAAAAAVVSAGLGLAALTGTWVGKVVSERETLIGQITAQGGTAAQQIDEIYADAWHSTALVNGGFALLALVVAVLVLVRPERPGWVRAVALAGAVLGAVGLFLSAGMYFDLFLDLPTAPGAP